MLSFCLPFAHLGLGTEKNMEGLGTNEIPDATKPPQSNGTMYHDPESVPNPLGAPLSAASLRIPKQNSSTSP